MQSIWYRAGLVGFLAVLVLWASNHFFPDRTTHTHRSASIKHRRVAYATYLSAPTEWPSHTVSGFWTSIDPYFDATRILAYQILHAPETRTKLKIPFVVFVHQNVDQDKRKRLQAQGAEVVELVDFRVDWIRPKDRRWIDALTKLRMWQMIQYDLIVFLDADSMLTRPLDELLSAEETLPRAPVQQAVSCNGVEVALPQTYIAAGLPQLRPNHSANPSRVPEDFWGWDNLNTGFLVLQPSLKLFEYFECLLASKDSFDSSIADQSVLNVAFTQSGPIPWTMIDLSWNVQWPWPDDIKSGYAVLHEKWWAPVHTESRDYLLSWYWRMIGFSSAPPARSAE
jgi:alpha-N-acetylglucosamine transferase